MEFSLVDDKPFRFRDELSGTNCNKRTYVECLKAFCLRPKVGNSEAAKSYYCLSLLNSILSREPLPLYTVSAPFLNDNDAPNKMNCILYIYLDLPLPYDQKCSFQITNGADSPDGEDSSLGRIREFCGEDNVRIDWKLNQFKWNVGDEVGFDFEAKDLPIIQLDDQCYGCEISNVNIPAYAEWPTSIQGRLTVSIKLTENAVDSLFEKMFAKSNLIAGNKRLLEDNVCSDLVIVAANGKEIKCHKAMLAVHSDVFKTMFETQMTESIQNVLQLRDMSEQGIRAFLRFIYMWDFKQASENCDIAFELLVAADKYNIPDLFSAMAELISFLPKQWFNVDMSVKLLAFAENQREICGSNHTIVQLQDKAIRILKSYT